MTKEEIINKIIKDRGFTSYLEIGGDKFYCFSRIKCNRKVVVDPANIEKIPELVNKTSDEYFKDSEDKFDLIFIDGLHEHEQVERDIINSMQHLNKDGIIVLHDCLPQEEIHQRVPRETRRWNGDVWRAFVGFRKSYPEINSYCYADDFGVGIIEYSDKELKTGFSTGISFVEFMANKKELLNLRTNVKAIYTIITNGYDELRTPKVRSSDYDYIAFTDDSNLRSDFWEIRLIPKSDNPVLQQREIKILAHKYLPEYQTTIYNDGCQQLIRDVNKIDFKGGFLIKKHHSRNCIYDEAKQIIDLNKDTAKNMSIQVEAYKSFHPANWGLYETGFMIRENCPEVNAICDAWWEEVKKFSHRDQMSLPVVFRKMNYRPTISNRAVINTFFKSWPHNMIRKKTSCRVWYSTPFSTEKNIGKSYNEFCAMVPDNDWICLRDGDTMFLRPDWGAQIEEIIKRHGNDYDLLGCVTNRLNSDKQRPFPKDFDNTDILHHKQVADKLYTENYCEVKKHNEPIAGLLLLFPKRIWNKIKFREKSIYFDTEFGKDLIKKGGRIGLMTGLYVLHFYRWDQENPRTYKKHLLV